MTPDARRVAAIAGLGYTEREAAFLDRVARHSGYFVRRQFLQCIGRATGQTVVDFTRKLVWRRHATVQTFCHAAQVVHLSARSLYRAAAADGEREHRRRRPAVGIKARLMALDYVLARPEVRFLATQTERVAHCEAAGVDRLWLPQQRYAGRPGGPSSIRYFVDAGPIGLEPDASGHACLVFAYVDDGDESVSRFDAYVRHYQRLWAALPAWRVVYVAANVRRLADAAATFRRLGADQVAVPPVCAAKDLNAFLDYCRLRQAFDAQQWATLDKAALDRFRDLRTRFAGHDGDNLYGQWERRGEAAIRHVLAASPSFDGRQSGDFQTCVLTHSYVATSPIGGRR